MLESSGKGNNPPLADLCSRISQSLSSKMIDGLLLNISPQETSFLTLFKKCLSTDDFMQLLEKASFNTLHQILNGATVTSFSPFESGLNIIYASSLILTNDGVSIAFQNKNNAILTLEYFKKNPSATNLLGTTPPFIDNTQGSHPYTLVLTANQFGQQSYNQLKEIKRLSDLGDWEQIILILENLEVSKSALITHALLLKVHSQNWMIIHALARKFWEFFPLVIHKINPLILWHAIDQSTGSNPAQFIQFSKEWTPSTIQLGRQSLTQHRMRLLEKIMRPILHASNNPLLQTQASIITAASPSSLSPIPRPDVDDIKVAPSTDLNASASSPAQVSGDKSTASILEEMAKLNLANIDFAALIHNGNLMRDLRAIKEKYQGFATNFPTKPICQWDINTCKTWAQSIKQIRQQSGQQTQTAILPSLIEILAVVYRAVFLDAGHFPRDVQIFSTLGYLSANTRGLLEQIATGEGKATIVSILAIIKVLQGNKVDVVTSSPILAARDSECKQALYSMFNITVADNWDYKNGVDNRQVTGAKPCYSADIVYGDASSFQWDILKDEYQLCGTRAGRPFQTVIVDEVDSMFVDGCSNTGALNSPSPAMERLEVLLVAAWQELSRIDQRLAQQPDLSPAEQNTYRVNTLKKFFEKLIESTDSPLHLPKHLKTYAASQIDNWITSAILARYHFKLLQHYVIVKGREGHDVVAPVDYNNTGVVHSSMVWDNGLHQFLQIKHNLAIEAQSVFSCSLSNLGFFKRYGPNLFGMTGTLGGKFSQALLKHVYPVDMAFIPTFRVKRFAELRGLLAEEEDTWIHAIIQSVLFETQKNRATLIICESIGVVNKLEAAFAQMGLRKPIKRYSRNDNAENKAVDEIADEGDIIIATNLAGRGTDIKTSEKVEENGGLHVCLTFLPLNKRVQDQGFGRTSRQGHFGTAQLVLDKQSTLKRLRTDGCEAEELRSIEDIIAHRDMMEFYTLEDMKLFQIKKTNLKDILFNEFSNLIKTVTAQDKDISKRHELEEQWGFWLKKWMDKIQKIHQVNTQEVLASHKQFSQKVLSEYANFAILNPTRLILDANTAFQEVMDANLFDQFNIDNDEARRIKSKRGASCQAAMAHYSKAIELDSVLSVQAYYNRAFIRIAGGVGNSRVDAVNDLKTARLLLEDCLIPELQATQVMANLNPEQTISQSPLIRKIQGKIDLYRLQLQYIDHAIGVISGASGENTLAVRPTNKVYETFTLLHLSDSQILEMYNTGIHQFCMVEEVPPPKDFDCFGSLGVALLGALQIAAGVLVSMMMPGLGTIVGRALMLEGVGDVMQAATAMMAQDFNWKEYQTNKTLSMAVSLISMGIDIIKANLPNKTVVTVKEPPKIMNRNEFIKQAKIGINEAIVTAGVRHVVNTTMDNFTRDMLGNFESDIKDCVASVLKGRLNQPETVQAINTLLSHDAIQGNLYYTSRIKKISFDIIKSKKAVKSISSKIMSGVLARQNAVAGSLLKLRDISAAMDEISNLSGRFCTDFIVQVCSMSRTINLPIEVVVNQELINQSRAEIFNQIIDTITQCIIATLHGQVLHPITEWALDNTVNDLANRIQQATQIAASHSPKTQRTIAEAPLSPPEQVPSTGDSTSSSAQAPNPIPHPVSVPTIEQAARPANDLATVQRTYPQPSASFAADMLLNDLDDDNSTKYSSAFPKLALLVNPVPDALNPRREYFRGDNRKPGKPNLIFTQGLFPMGPETSLLDHANSRAGTALGFVSASTCDKAARVFPTLPTEPNTYLYKLVTQQKPIDVNAVLGKASPFPLEKEVVFPKIAPHEIEGAWRVVVHPDYPDKRYVKEFHQNPHFNPDPYSLERRLFSTGQYIGRGLTALGIYQDGRSLVHEYSQSLQTGDFTNTYEETARIGGGWSGAWVGAKILGTIGMEGCSMISKHPLVPPTCGVLASLPGAYLGYRYGGEETKKRASSVLGKLSIFNQGAYGEENRAVNIYDVERKPDYMYGF
jgi:preprotein translocase subunit SecA